MPALLTEQPLYGMQMAVQTYYDNMVSRTYQSVAVHKHTRTSAYEAGYGHTA